MLRDGKWNSTLLIMLFHNSQTTMLRTNLINSLLSPSATESAAAKYTRRFVTALLATACLQLALFSGSANAQSSGLKLGGEKAETPKLDLGAAPVKKQPAANANAGGKSGLVTHGAWQVNCNPNADCAMAQIGKDKSGTPVLEMVVRKLEAPLEADGRTAIAVLDFITPLGVVLISGLELKIDSAKGESAPFQICTEQGCLVREPVDQGLIDRLKRGNSARVTVVAANQGEVSANMSLSGFTKAYNSLK